MTPEEALINELSRHITTMAPHQKDRIQGRLIIRALTAMKSDRHEITRLENEIDRLTEANLDMARELGARDEPDEPFCR